MQLLRIAHEVREALSEGRPVVALESSVFSAFPGSVGWELVRESQALIRRQGAVPATIGVARGEILVGLEEPDEKEFALSGANARKIGARDVAGCLVRGEVGATTIGATLAIGKLAGIRFAAASGLGGVHRGYAERLDISADIGELATSPVLIVTSGVKSFLDVDATVEMLETLAVPVIGWRTDTLPLYFSGQGGPPTSTRVDDVVEAASIAWHHWNTLGRTGGLLLGRPPRQNLPEVQDLIAQSLRRAEEAGVTGPAVTAHVLGDVHRASGGVTKLATQELILDTADLAGEIANAYAGLGTSR